MSTLILGISGARGIVDDGLDEEVAARLTAAFLQEVGVGPIVLGRDSRPSGPRLSGAVSALLSAAGAEVRDLGIVPTPTVQVAVEAAGARGGLVVTASHNPPAWNALKFVGPEGTFLAASRMKHLLAAFHRPPAEARAYLAAASSCRTAGTTAGAGPGTSAAGEEAIADHVARICAGIDEERIRACGLRVVVDGVHGAGPVLVSPLLAGLGVVITWIAGEPNGELPAHPEPRAERLAPLARRVAEERAHLGFALDPDGDRCALVLPDRVLGEEWTLPLCAYARLMQGERGPLVANLSTSAMLDDVAQRFGVPLERTPVGEAHVVSRARAVGALMAGEGNGGVIDPRVHWGRDAGVAIALLLELAAGDGRPPGALEQALGTLTVRAMHKETLAVAPARFERLAARLRAAWGPPASEADGLKWVAGDAWLHLRPSNTEPIVRAIVEAPGETDASDWLRRLRALADAESAESSR
ncbi:MAG: phosphoglucosamine mutase [Candidatus Eisenbacteria bacterium]|nr:phosphoglucosamine mutase [Candidatus Eisenbacteria bacterium]